DCHTISSTRRDLNTESRISPRCRRVWAGQQLLALESVDQLKSGDQNVTSLNHADGSRSSSSP
ncbi:hypothetical protein CEXT_144491, partial [Caerostris extrusa]